MLETMMAVTMAGLTAANWVQMLVAWKVVRMVGW